MQPDWSKTMFFGMSACGVQLGIHISTDTERDWLEYIKGSNWEPRAGMDRESDSFAQGLLFTCMYDIGDHYFYP